MTCQSIEETIRLYVRIKAIAGEVQMDSVNDDQRETLMFLLIT